MKIVFYLNSLLRGGTERVVASLASHWAALGREVVVITEVSKEKDTYALHPAVQRLTLFPDSGARSPGKGLLANVNRIWRLRKLLIAMDPNLVIAMINTANVVLALAGIGLQRVTLIGSERVYPPAVPLSRLWSMLRYLSYQYLDVMVVQTELGAAWVRRHTRARHVRVIANPIQLPLPVYGSIVSPSSVGPAGVHRLLAVGRLEHQKGFDLLLEAFSRVAPEYGEWSLFILGEGSLRECLTQSVRRLGLEGRAFLVGSVGNVGDWYVNSDLFVLSSRFEGFPNALLEALAHGLPAVSFDCDTGPRDLIRPSWNGLLVAPEDAGNLAMALRRMMSDPEFRRLCATNASQTAGAYSIEQIAALWDEATGTTKTP